MLKAERGGLAAERLVVGTLMTESGGRHLDQITGPKDVTLGTAYGVFQIEPATHEDLWESWLRYRKPDAAKIRITVLRGIRSAPAGWRSIPSEHTRTTPRARTCRLAPRRHLPPGPPRG